MSVSTSNKKLSLDGIWQFAYLEEGTVDENAVISGHRELDWIDSKVPGNAQLTLFEHGLCKDPFFGDNYLELQKYEFHEWWYRKSFTIPGEMKGKELELKFHGMDTYSRIWLNGRLIGETDNMFIPYSFDITDYVSADTENVLIVKFRSPLFETMGRETSGCHGHSHTGDRFWVRKAAHTFGWDIAPRLLTAGIWRGVEIIGHGEYEISDLFFRVVSLKEERARLAFHLDFKLPRRSWTGLTLKIEGECGDSRFACETTVMSPHVKTAVDLDNPKLWWPYNVGTPNLYNLKATLLKDGVPQHTMERRIGIRTVELNQDKNDDGTRNFIVEINGTPVFCKGTNSVPMDAFHCRDEERTPAFIELVRECNCNMIRIWGGGVYESDLFYDLCDEYGIMIMQDFMFACAIYPQSDEFLNTVRNEAQIIVKRLRNHPSIVIWCGDNEVDMAYTSWYDQSQSPENNKISRIVLREVAHYFDGTRPYMKSSPFSPTVGVDPNSDREGDKHLYRHGTYFKAPDYINDYARFYSEIGHLSFTCVESLRKFIPEDVLWPIEKRECWDLHFGSNKNRGMEPQPGRMDKTFQSVENMFGRLPDNLEDLVSASQLVQGEALKFWIERCRQRKFHCGGILWWNLIDCWPQFSDAIVDYYYVKKLSFDYVTRSQADLLVSMGEDEGNGNPVIIVNDTLKPVKCSVRICVYDKEGKLLEECNLSDITVNANSKFTPNHIDINALKSRAGGPVIACMHIADREGAGNYNHYLGHDIPVDYGTYLKLYEIFKGWAGQA